MNIPTMRIVSQRISMLIVLLSLISCYEKTDNTHAFTPETSNDKSSELPPPIKAKYLSPDSLLLPTVVPLKKQPETQNNHAHVQAVARQAPI